MNGTMKRECEKSLKYREAKNSVNLKRNASCFRDACEPHLKHQRESVKEGVELLANRHCFIRCTCTN